MEAGKILVALSALVLLVAVPLISDQPLEALMHTFAVFLAIITVYVGWEAKELFIGEFASAMNYLFLGIGVLVLVHASEIFTEIFKIVEMTEMQIDVLEHVLFFIGMSLVVYGLYEITKVVKNIQK